MPKADFRVLSLAQWEDEVANNNMEMARSGEAGKPIVFNVDAGGTSGQIGPARVRLRR